MYHGLHADIYHLHHAELLPLGPMLKQVAGAAVIFDIHEDFEPKIKTRELIPSSIKPVLEWIFPPTLALFTKLYDARVTVTEWLAYDLRESGIETTVIRNLPLRPESLEQAPPIQRSAEHVLVYVGGLRRTRCENMVMITEALNDAGYDVNLWLIGSFEINETEEWLSNYLTYPSNWNPVRTIGHVNHSDVFSDLASVDIGLALLDVTFAQGAIPTKMI